LKQNIRILAILVAGLFAANGAVLADKGGKHGKKDERGEERYDDRRQTEVNIYFHDDSRRIVGDYYGAQARGGKCPPGLAKKHNGCQPPGQARKWSKGRPLPADVRYYALPPDLLYRLPPPPPRHRYVQVAGDILLIAVGTSMVVDAMEDILR
jgi:Ni/Co efflux regulator RcnB